MTIGDRIDNNMDKMKGKGNQVGGRLTGDRDQEMRGKGQELKGDAKNVLTDVKESFKK
jgi:uncharacterized protein YjbJ (UPF0337 family)